MSPVNLKITFKNKNNSCKGLFPLICRSLSVRYGGCSCSFNGCWHRKRADAKNFILFLVRPRVHVYNDIIGFPKEGWTFTVFGSKDDLNFMIAKSFVIMRGCWQLLIGICQSLWFETAVVSYWRTSLPSGKMIIRLFAFCGSGGFSDFTANFGKILRILALKPGGVG